MPKTSAQRHTRHASSTCNATYLFAKETNFLARFKVEEYACACESDALVQPVALLETLRDLPLHSLAHASVVILLPTRQNNNHNNNNTSQLTTLTYVTLLLLFRLSAIKRPPTSVKPLALCITRRHTRRQPPASNRIHIRTFKHACTTSHTAPPLTCPCLPSRSTLGA